mgnify:CR=1 FL=1
MPSKNNANRAFAEFQLNTQSGAAKDFKGQTIFIPGNHDWYSGLKGLKRQEKYIEDSKNNRDNILSEKTNLISNNEEEIIATWQKGLVDFKETREQYLLY